MQLKSYKEATDWLFSQFPSYQNLGAKALKPTLDNTRKLVDLLGNPEQQLNFVHVAGTNGKGSTCAMLASILTENGYKTGLFSSPHIVDFRERIRVNGAMIPENEVLQFCNSILNQELDFSPSFFEVSFAMALSYFNTQKCDIVVLETGLGGRLDATNIVDPLLSVITNISLEHTQFLGDTLDKIAFEKAGIIKKDRPVIIGEYLQETKKVFEQKAKELTAPILFVQEEEIDSNRYQMPLLGEYQQQNLKTVLSTIKTLNKLGFKVNEKSIQPGLDHLFKNTGFSARMQIINKQPLTILDVSHNVAGIQQTLKAIEKINKGKLHIIYGSSSDKDVLSIIQLFPHSANVNLCSFSNPRSLNRQELEQIAKKLHPAPKIYVTLKEALKESQSTANKEDTILIFGSFFLVSDFF